MSIKDLIGYKLVRITDDEILINRDGVTHRVAIKDNEGDCCSYNDIKSTLLISEADLERNPVITAVNVFTSEDYDSQRCKLTFYGEYAPMASVDTLSSSGSGWTYGASVSIECDAIGLNETLSEW